jgi:hypothetical protein
MNDPWYLAYALSAAATFYDMSGEPDEAFALATEGLAIARRHQMPEPTVRNLAALAGSLAESDPEQGRALLKESVQLRASLRYESWMEVSQAALISARLDDWPLSITLAGPAIRYLHWNGDWPLLAAIVNITARALATGRPESAATLQGVARQLVDFAAKTHNATRYAGATEKESEIATRQADDRDFVTQLRRNTTRMLRDALGDQRLRELRAQGEQMDRDNAVAYALTAITSAT